MAKAQALIDSFARPAAVIAVDGQVACANTLFREARPPVERLAELKPGERLEVPDGAGGSWSWSVRALPGGERLARAKPSQIKGLDAREHYLAALSHELRTPLNGVLGMAGLLAATRLDADQRAYVQALKDTGAHLLALVNDVLDLAKLETGQIDLEPAPVDLEQLMQGVCELLSPRAYEKGLEIAWAVCDCPSRIMADEGRLRQILFNLAGNAIKFTETGGVLIQARQVGKASGKEAVLRFVVKDSGPGVPEAEQARIFEDYARAPGTDARLEGAGLGLAIVRRLAAAHNGTIGLSTPPGGGSEFCFEARFPLAAGEPGERPLRGLTIQLCSPSAAVRAAAICQIEASGGRAVVSAHVPRQLRHDVAAVLVDRPLARGAPPPAGPPALVMLAAEQRGEIESLRRAGYAAYLIKPLRRASLAERVLAVIDRRNAKTRPRPAEDERVAVASAVGVRVLLAEDNPINALLARTLLEREGCAVSLAANGWEALAAGTTGGCDLILMDLRMPGMDGLQASRALRAAGIKTPIVALTADAFEDDRKTCLAAGMDDFLAKPLETSALRAVLARWSGGQAWTPSEGKDKLAS